MSRGFPPSEFRTRTGRAQAAMADTKIDALLLTTDAHIRYFTGFLTRFWESPSRPWYLILPQSGEPIAVIPSIGAALMSETWISDIRTWRSPDYDDDGVTLLADTLQSVVPADGSIGVPSGPETHLRMPLDDWARLGTLTQATFRDEQGIVERLRMIKSDAEVTKIATACAIADRAFARVPEIASVGTPLSRIFRDFQRLCLEEGADWVPYLAGAAAPGGYADVISPATDRPLALGDVLMLDTGLVHDGYFCDFDRNFSVGPPTPAIRRAHETLIKATEAAFAIARPGATAADLFHAMNSVVSDGKGGSDAGRFGHGLGLQLTEAPSLLAADTTRLEPGLVLTLEPGIALGPDRILVHEENIVIRDNAPDWLSTPASAEIMVITP